MDPLTQGLIAAAAAQLTSGHRLGRRSALIGTVAGVLPDADVFIHSSTDPLLAVEYHRQFTHSLAFIPIGGAMAALPFLFFSKDRKAVLAAAVAGYATHGLLDACTTYGTQLLWPFSRTRVAWDTISIIDPLFTLALLIAVVVGSRRSAAAALVFCALYLSIGLSQRERASGVQQRLAALRGHERVRAEVFPTVGNHLVWRSLYDSGGTLHADRLRVPWFGAARVATGARVDGYELPPRLRANQRAARDFERFRWFSAGWVALDPRDPAVIGDVRYSMRTEAFEPIWGVRLEPETQWVNRSRDRSLSIGDLWREIDGSDPRYKPVERTGHHPSRPLIIRNARVGARPGMIVIIEGGTILGVEPADGVVPPPDSEIIDAGGHELIALPGSSIEEGQLANMQLVARGRVVMTIRNGGVYR
ncbi:MAG TPA: metal-dependent hydrolase [Thermoanaerobaculia bacterium]|nr:metal-dependent hydrolase [Thermoanaerobaculia bacterium]